MKVAKLYSFNDIRIEDIPVPEPGPHDALIKTKACGICSGDVMPWYIEKKAPLVIGHEPAGEIVELGKELLQPSAISHQPPAFKIGDRVFVHHHAPCMNCKYCLHGDFVQCDTWRKTKIIPGGVSEYILIPGINLLNDTIRLPENIGFEDGTLIEPAACVVKSLKRANIKKGAAVLVIGLGVMGQIHILLARELGAKKIIGADMVSFRLEKALEFGADYVINVSETPPHPPLDKGENSIFKPHLSKGGLRGGSLFEQVKELTEGFMADVVIAGPNSVDAMQQGIQATAPGGTVVLFTPAKPGQILNIDPNHIYFNDISIVTSYSCGPDDTKEALRLISRGLVTAEKLVTHRFPIDETEKAYRLTAEAKESLKCLIVF